MVKPHDLVDWSEKSSNRIQHWWHDFTNECEHYNYPLYMKCIACENELKFHYTVHTSLDVVEEKISAGGKSSGDLRELYLGLLYPTEDYKVYGYVTNTKIKFVLVVESFNTNLRDNEIRSMFRKLHTAYVDMLCNPFYTPGNKITSMMFEDTVNDLMASEQKPSS